MKSNQGHDQTSWWLLEHNPEAGMKGLLQIQTTSIHNLHLFKNQVKKKRSLLHSPLTRSQSGGNWRDSSLKTTGTDNDLSDMTCLRSQSKGGGGRGHKPIPPQTLLF